MRDWLLSVLLSLSMLGLGCATLKSVSTNPYSGETWKIMSRPLAPDAITYCLSPPDGPTQCQDGIMLDQPPPPPR